MMNTVNTEATYPKDGRTRPKRNLRERMKELSEQGQQRLLNTHYARTLNLIEKEAESGKTHIVGHSVPKEILHIIYLNLQAHGFDVCKVTDTILNISWD